MPDDKHLEEILQADPLWRAIDEAITRLRVAPDRLKFLQFYPPDTPITLNAAWINSLAVECNLRAGRSLFECRVSDVPPYQSRTVLHRRNAEPLDWTLLLTGDERFCAPLEDDGLPPHELRALPDHVEQALREWQGLRQKQLAACDEQILGTTGRTSTSKQSTGASSAQEKMIAALSQHHQFDGNSCGTFEPIGVNALTRKASVGSNSTVSEFFKAKFGGHDAYKVICRDKGKLINSLKALRGEITPERLYGRTPPGEGDRTNE